MVGLLPPLPATAPCGLLRRPPRPSWPRRRTWVLIKHQLHFKNKKATARVAYLFLMAEMVGFEPTNGFLRYTLSKRAPSTTRTHLHYNLVEVNF